jgi:hypothetical protein
MLARHCVTGNVGATGIARAGIGLPGNNRRQTVPIRRPSRRPLHTGAIGRDPGVGVHLSEQFRDQHEGDSRSDGSDDARAHSYRQTRGIVAIPPPGRQSVCHKGAVILVKKRHKRRTRRLPPLDGG